MCRRTPRATSAGLGGWMRSPTTPAGQEPSVRDKGTCLGVTPGLVLGQLRNERGLEGVCPQPFGIQRPDVFARVVQVEGGEQLVDGNQRAFETAAEHFAEPRRAQQVTEGAVAEARAHEAFGYRAICV